jgi:hypothetical protein
MSPRGRPTVTKHVTSPAASRLIQVGFTHRIMRWTTPAWLRRHSTAGSHRISWANRPAWPGCGHTSGRQVAAMRALKLGTFTRKPVGHVGL